MSWTDLDDDEEWAEDEEADDSDMDDSDADLLSCPSCGKAVHEDTQQCPHCGDWITPIHADKPWKRAVWAVAAVLVIISLIVVTVL